MEGEVSEIEARVRAQLEQFCTAMLGMEVVELGQRITGVQIGLGGEGLYVSTAEDAQVLNEVLESVGLPGVVEEGEIALRPAVMVLGNLCPWVVWSGEQASSGYRYHLSAADDDAEAVAACESVCAALLGQRVEGVEIEEDGSLTLTLERGVIRVLTPAEVVEEELPYGWVMFDQEVGLSLEAHGIVARDPHVLEYDPEIATSVRALQVGQTRSG